MIDLSNLKIRQDIDRVHLLQWGHFSILMLAFVAEGILDFKIITMCLRILMGLLFYKLYFKTLADLYYSFWTFSAGLALYLSYNLYCVVANQSNLQVFYLYLVAMIILFVQMYILLSPIYYPRVSWWEYDFRYRDDLKVKLYCDELESEARLTDLRRGAGCLSAFKNLEVGTNVKIHADNGIQNFTFLVEIMSRRQYSLGRPSSHGVKFIFNEEYSEKSYDEFYTFWKREKIAKSKKRFTKKVDNA
ncbi:hypothetical protein [Halobacteriovorax sp. HLS]|uniref:hypothetical protein n=1 Tax=Halobacteriovorax sp. HLS TaxID=2234000 RepID=UPI000FD8D106|nr:hypothetical protein [Halobacteriovorax sp. HLS]